MATIGSGIKSVQRGEKILASGTTTDTVTITAVDLTKSFLLPPSNNNPQSSVKGYLTNSTTVTFTKVTSASACLIAWEVVEFY